MKHIIFSPVTFALSLLITVLSSYAAMTTTTKSIFRTRLCAHSTSDIPFSTITSTRNSMKKSIGIGLSTLIVSSRATRAANVAESSLADSKKAAQTIRDALAKVGEMEKAGDDYEAIAKLLGDKCFAQFSDNAFVLTKSAALTPDDRIALGTIKRYGLVADAIIMIGGLSEALRAGGIKVEGVGVGTKTKPQSRMTPTTRVPRRLTQRKSRNTSP